MRKIKDVLRLKFDSKLPNRSIADSLGLSHSTVGDYLGRFRKAGFLWPIPADITDAVLEAKLFPPIPTAGTPRPLPDFQHIHDELRDHKNLNLTLDQLWLEYRDDHPETGYQYTRFCTLYKEWLGRRDYCLRQEHKAGEKLFVDYGDGLSLVDPVTGELTPTELFVAVWGASNHTFVEATRSQSLPDWLGSHVRAFRYFGCVPRVLVPDNLKSGVSDACWFEPELNPAYADLAAHYKTAVLPARPRKPRDKAKVEAGVLIAKRWILAKLRHRIFHTLAEMNAAIAELLELLNARLLRKAKISRRDLFDSVDRPAALPLPEVPYEFAEWRVATVNLDYHIEVDRHYYSVPYRLLRQKVDVRVTATTVEAFLKGERVAAHARSRDKHTHTTMPGHMPPEHRRYTEWSPSRFIAWAEKTGPATKTVIERILGSRMLVEYGYRGCLGVQRLGKTVGPQRLEAACLRAIQFHSLSYRAVRSILERGLDRQVDVPPAIPLPIHANIRGKDVYN
jgi:transposase